MSGFATAVLVRDADGAEFYHQAYAGGSAPARVAFNAWERRWRDLGLAFESDPETLTLKRPWDARHTIVARWHEARAAVAADPADTGR